MCSLQLENERIASVVRDSCINRAIKFPVIILEALYSHQLPTVFLVKVKCVCLSVGEIYYILVICWMMSIIIDKLKIHCF
jgi:hypothetical protein